MTRSARPRVVVTGIGAVSAWGWGTEALWDGLCSDRTAIGPFTRFENDDYFTHIAAEVPEPPAALAQRLQRHPRSSHADRYAIASLTEGHGPLKASTLYRFFRYVPGGHRRRLLGSSGDGTTVSTFPIPSGSSAGPTSFRWAKMWFSGSA